MIAPGYLQKMPDFETQEFTEELYDLEDFAEGTTFDGGASSIPVSFSLNNLTIYSNPFVEKQQSGLVNTLTNTLPVVGNLRAGAPMGMGVNQCEEMIDFERGVENLGSYVATMEPEIYFGQPSMLMRMPRVVLIRGAVSEVVLDALRAQHETLIERLKIQLIFEGESSANSWGPFCYGSPFKGWTQPGVKESFTGFEGGEFLTIYFTGSGYGPLLSGGISCDPELHFGSQMVATPYFFSISGIEVDSEGFITGGPYPGSGPMPPQPGFVHTSIPDIFENIPGADGAGESAYWTSLNQRYYRRGFIMHNIPEEPYRTKYRIVGSGDVEFILDGGDPAMWTFIDHRVYTEVIEEGSNPPGAPDSTSYFGMFAAPGQTLGRTVSGEADIAAAIVEDILSFWPS